MAVIEFEQVTKIYRLGAHRIGLRHALPQMVRRLVRRGPQDDRPAFKALEEVSFSVERGEVLGIIGHNGAGKSTALKLLSKVTFPTSGLIHLQGRLAALIELGAGFHPDLSGRENIYLNGAILGLTRREIEAQFGSIVEFAGLERFIDTPIKRYSSGMYVRLAFAVAAHVRADCLLVDEVLSVGDMAFQQKSMARMNDLRDNGTTIVFVSHNLPAVRMFCSRVLLLRDGKLIADGDPGAVIEEYQKQEQDARIAALARLRAQDGELMAPLDERQHSPDSPLMPRVELLNRHGLALQDFAGTEPIIVRCHYDMPRPMKNPVCVVQIRRRVDGINCFKVYMNHPSQPFLQGTGFFEAHFDPLRLLPGAYIVEGMLHDIYDTNDIAVGAPATLYIAGRLRSESAGILQPRVQWAFDAEATKLFDGDVAMGQT